MDVDVIAVVISSHWDSIYLSTDQFFLLIYHEPGHAQVEYS